jgi:hypothetical protein
MARLTSEQWKAIRDSWEYDLDRPSYGVAAKRAAEKHGFEPPDKSSISRRITGDKKKGQDWERQGALSGINQNAHRKADTIMGRGGEGEDPYSSATQRDDKAEKLKKVVAATEDAEDLRAEVIARHRKEWLIVAGLRSEALQHRLNDPKNSFEKAKLAKITAEMTQIQQNGERKAWGLDEINIDVSKLTDAQLQDLINGKMPK